jgi:hypothetical protein
MMKKVSKVFVITDGKYVYGPDYSSKAQATAAMRWMKMDTSKLKVVEDFVSADNLQEQKLEETSNVIEVIPQQTSTPLHTLPKDAIKDVIENQTKYFFGELPDKEKQFVEKALLYATELKMRGHTDEDIASMVNEWCIENEKELD